MSVTVIGVGETQIISHGEQGPLGPAGPAGPQGPIGPPGSGLTQINSLGIAPAETRLLDSLTALDFRTAEWLISITNTVTAEQKSQRILASHNTVGASHQSSYLGDSIPVFVDVILDAPDFRLELTNNGTDILDARVLRFPISLL